MGQKISNAQAEPSKPPKLGWTYMELTTHSAITTPLLSVDCVKAHVTPRLSVDCVRKLKNFQISKKD